MNKFKLKIINRLHPKLQRCIELFRLHNIPIIKLFYNPIWIPFLLMGINLKPGLFLSKVEFYVRFTIYNLIFQFYILPLYYIEDVPKNFTFIMMIIVNVLITLFIYKYEIEPTKRAISKYNWDEV